MEAAILILITMQAAMFVWVVTKAVRLARSMKEVQVRAANMEANAAIACEHDLLPALSSAECVQQRITRITAATELMCKSLSRVSTDEESLARAVAGAQFAGDLVDITARFALGTNGTGEPPREVQSAQQVRE